ncbi:MAG TPA: hypothetical protein VK793_00845, partial [Steroidobacteraceae bacterium]|nr:hypothetical protein [Steroidobacteraceae bacterium]
MKFQRVSPSRASVSFAVSAVCAFSLAACGGGSGGGGSSSSGQVVQQMSGGFADVALVSNKTGVVATTTVIDANLSNPWGLATA